MTPSLHEAAPHHMPFFIVSPGQTDSLMVIMAIILLLALLGIGVFFFWLHSLPERMVHHKVQFDIVAVLALLSLFTHIHAFWVAALLLALIQFPDFSTWDFGKPLNQMAASLDRLATTNEASSHPKTAEDVLKKNPSHDAIGDGDQKQGT